MSSELEKLLQVGSMAVGGGSAQAVLGGAQALYGLAQMPKAKAAFERAKAAAPSLETPAQFYENYKNAYDSTIAGMQSDAIQANLATSVQALQGAGGRALVGGLGAVTASAQSAQNQMLGQERAMRLQAGQQLAAAEERAIGRKEKRSQQEIAYANQAYQAALANVGAGLGSLGEGLMYREAGLSAEQKADRKAKRQEALQDLEAGVSDLTDRAKEGANYLKERVSYEMDMMPERINNFQTQRAMKKTLRQAQKRGNPPTMVNSIAPKSVNPSDVYAPNPASMMQPVDMTKPAPSFSDLSPVMGSAIPKEFQNEQAIKQIDALGKMYNQAAPALNSLMPTNTPANGEIEEYLPMLRRAAFFRAGGMMTNGEFSHESNPIDIVQEGVKVGEMTGGEYILNPTQANKIASQSSYARKLFKKFEKNAKKNK